MNYVQYIEINPAIRFGNPIIKGTRICVVDILHWLSLGMTNEEIILNYPLLKVEHFYAALAYAAQREKTIKIVVV